mmetsp:Transcript_22253/g.55060  ORF Transcript_22253/g.55060 Transcript_22253/m.55060 type:complete len:217 (-) Transcript_22253:586-1236(-)
MRSGGHPASFMALAPPRRRLCDPYSLARVDVHPESLRHRLQVADEHAGHGLSFGFNCPRRHLPLLDVPCCEQCILRARAHLPPPRHPPLYHLPDLYPRLGLPRQPHPRAHPRVCLGPSDVHLHPLPLWVQHDVAHPQSPQLASSQQPMEPEHCPAVVSLMQRRSGSVPLSRLVLQPRPQRGEDLPGDRRLGSAPLVPQSKSSLLRSLHHQPPPLCR